ncbi:MAG: hypothetical protein Q9162_005150 [Coniocarpon cinnabarinum]
MGAEPWLDSLSEDWEDSPPASLPAPRVRTASSTLPPSAASRIPRYVSPHKNALPDPKRNAGNEGATSKTRSGSVRNKSADSLPKASAGDSNPTAQPSNTATLSSAPSVIRHEADASSLVKSHPKTAPESGLPDFTNIALRQQDLFSPAGIEGIFHKPALPEESSPNKQSFSFYNDLSHMPSSPPPWLTPESRVGLNVVRVEHPPSTVLPVVREQEQDGGSVAGMLPQDSSAAQATRAVWDFKLSGSGLQTPSESAVLKKDFAPSSSIDAPSSSSGTDGFSPVFVSKHNTVDGRVKYAAVDPAGLPRLGDNVNIERGGHSSDGSFKNRPLSPSMSSTALPSDSLAPSDSVSQVRTTTIVAESRGMQSSQPRFQQSHAISDTQKSAEVHPRREDFARQTSGSTQSGSIQTTIHQGSHSNQAVTQFAAPQRSPSGDLEEIDNDSQLTREDAQAEKASHRLSRTETEIDSPHQRPPSVAGRKRKNARYDNSQTGSDASVIASRDILRPRNPTPWHGHGHCRRSASADTDVHFDSVMRKTWAASIQDQKRPLESRGTVKARALAIEAATYGQQGGNDGDFQVRKKSVSTQDYLNEAMRIMDLIRARKQVATSDWSSNSGIETDEHQNLDVELDRSVQSLDRPPSRDGPISGWRSGKSARHTDPRIESQLRKFEETGDESFLVSSIVRSVKMTGNGAFKHEQDGITITDDPGRELERRNSDPGQLNTSPDIEDPDGIFDSAETAKSSSTQKMSSIGRIAPETVSHLIKDEEAGMRFDTTRQTWIKCKLRPLQPSSTNVPVSSSGTEDDPLGGIPDLSVYEERRNAKRDQDDSEERDAEWQPAGSSFENINRESKRQHENACFVTDDPLDLDVEKRSKSSEAKHSGKLPVAGNKSNLTADWDAPTETIESHDDDREQDDAVASLPRPREKTRRREQSVLFSSPPVSKEWEAKHWTSSSGPSHPHPENDSDDFDPESSQIARLYPTHRKEKHSSQARQNQHWSRSVSLSQSEQLQEISFVEQRPDGRTFSLSMSVSTPVQARRHSNARALTSTGLRNCSFVGSLSPLSDFSVSNDDHQHRMNNALSRPVEMLKHHGRTTARTALTTNALVEKLADAEPDEPYWDFMHRLNLADQRLDTLNMLDEFCPRLEELNASNNELQHLSGVPASLRKLDMSNNRLTSLTDLSHLRNLQSVHLSHNSITTIAGFGSLTHLRELNLAHNCIDEIDGLLDLDGLIAVDLSHNKISSVDLTSAQLMSLKTMDLSHNYISSISGLSSLTSLKKLDVTDNRLSQFMSPNLVTNSSLKNLTIKQNQIERLDVSLWPSLKILCADENNIASVDNISGHSSLHTVYLRSQKLRTGQAVCLDDFIHLTNVYLCGTSLGPMLSLTVPCLNLCHLDVSFTGLQALPSNFGTLVPNLRILNLNANGIKDIRPLEGIVALNKLLVAQNRLSRLRNFVKVLNRLSALLPDGSRLDEIDVRANPLTLGFYAAMDGSLRTSKRDVTIPCKQTATGHVLQEQEQAVDELHLSRLDRDMKMKRRVYEMLIGSKCGKLKKLDGKEFERDKLQRQDDTWDGLVNMGVVCKVT